MTGINRAVTMVDELEVEGGEVEKREWSAADAKGVEDELIVVVGVKSVVGGDELIYKEGHLGASMTRGKHMDAMWCHVKCHVRRRACEAVGRPCRACEAPWVWAEPARPPAPTVLVEHRETLPVWLTTSTVLRQVLRGALKTFVAPVVDAKS